MEQATCEHVQRQPERSSSSSSIRELTGAQHLCHPGVQNADKYTMWWTESISHVECLGERFEVGMVQASGLLPASSDVLITGTVCSMWGKFWASRIINATSVSVQKHQSSWNSLDSTTVTLRNIFFSPADAWNSVVVVLFYFISFSWTLVGES